MTAIIKTSPRPSVPRLDLSSLRTAKGSAPREPFKIEYCPVSMGPAEAAPSLRSPKINQLKEKRSQLAEIMQKRFAAYDADKFGGDQDVSVHDDFESIYPKDDQEALNRIRDRHQQVAYRINLSTENNFASIASKFRIRFNTTLSGV